MRQDFAPLTQRLSLLHVVRITSVVAALLLAAFGPKQLSVAPIDVVLVSAAYLLVTTGIEAVRRFTRARVWAVVNVVILVDALYVLLMTAWSGETLSPLLPFAFLHLVAITLLLSYRTGLKAALWYALVFCAFDALIAAGTIPAVGGGRAPTYQVAGTVMSFLVFTVFTAVFSSYNEGALRRSRWYFRSLANLALELEQQTLESDICRTLADHTRNQLGFERVAVCTDGRRTLGAIATATGVVLLDTETPLADDHLVDEALSSGGPLLRRLGDSEQLSFVDVVLPCPSNVAVMAMKTVDNDIAGVIIAEWGDDRGIPQATADALVHTANHGALALRNARLLAELERRAARDPLTGLGNRRSFDESLDRELSRCRRDGSTLSLAVFDLDHFKSINDDHGHQVGDQVLRVVSRLLTNGVREMDLTSRYGGEEFVILFPGTASDDAAMTAERLRAEVAEHTGPVPVTISAGVASFPDQASSGAELMAMADAALYEAKRSGRNKVMVAARPAGSGTASQPEDGAADLDPVDLRDPASVIDEGERTQA